MPNMSNSHKKAKYVLKLNLARPGPARPNAFEKAISPKLIKIDLQNFRYILFIIKNFMYQNLKLIHSVVYVLQSSKKKVFKTSFSLITIKLINILIFWLMFLMQKIIVFNFVLVCFLLKIDGNRVKIEIHEFWCNFDRFIHVNTYNFKQFRPLRVFKQCKIHEYKILNSDFIF